MTATTGPAAEAARAAFRERAAAKGHAVDNARLAAAGLETALEHDEGERLGGKSAEAARFILRAIDRELANA
jgi:hypothetical protein